MTWLVSRGVGLRSGSSGRAARLSSARGFSRRYGRGGPPSSGLSDEVCVVGVTDAALGAGKATVITSRRSIEIVIGFAPGLTRVPLRRLASGSWGCCPMTAAERVRGPEAGGVHRARVGCCRSSRAGSSKRRWALSCEHLGYPPGQAPARRRRQPPQRPHAQDAAARTRPRRCPHPRDRSARLSRSWRASATRLVASFRPRRRFTRWRSWRYSDAYALGGTSWSSRSHCSH